MPIPNLYFGNFNKNNSVIQIKSFVMSVGSIQVITNMLLFYALAKKGFISLGRSVMNEMANVLWAYCCGVADTGHCTEVAKPRCAISRRRKQHILRGCGLAPMICLESIPDPHTHGYILTDG